MGVDLSKLLASVGFSLKGLVLLILLGWVAGSLSLYFYKMHGLDENEDRISAMYRLAGEDYSQVDLELERVDQGWFFNHVLERFYVRGLYLSSRVFEKENLSTAGFGGSCDAFEYLDLFGDYKKNTYSSSSTCCESGFLGVNSVIESADKSRYLVMCGVSGGAHVISVPVHVLSGIVRPYYAGR